MIKTFKTELKKIKHRHFPLLFAVLTGFLFLWLFATFRGIDDAERACGYFSVLYNFPMINTIILPLFIAVLASRIWDMEHKGNTLKLLCTLEDRKTIYLNKSILGGSFLLLFSFVECLLILALGRIFGFVQAIPTTHIVCFFVTTSLTSLLLYFIQEILSFSFDNQIVALAVGLIGSFVGLFSLYLPRSFSQFVIWSYYSVLQTVGMNWDVNTRICTYYESPLSLGHLFVTFILFLLAAFAGKIIFERKDI